MKRVFLLDGLRTHIGLRGGQWRSTPPEQLAAPLLSELTRRYPEKADQVICGNAAGTGGNPARMAALLAGLPEDIPAVTVDLQCASGLSAVELASLKIRCGEAELIAAGGFESSSLQPVRSYQKNDPRYSGEPYICARFSPGEGDDRVMLRGAERLAKREGVQKEELDFWALESHRRAREARNAGMLSDVILPIGESRDEGIRDRMSQKLLDRLPPLFPEGITNAANACPINDGAAMLLLCSEEYLRRNRLVPKAEFLGFCTVAGDPAVSPSAAGMAAECLMRRKGLAAGEIGAFEYNEAFGVIDVLFQRLHPSLTERYNRLGGALAYGHPYGASGAVLLLHLLKSLELSGEKLGICSIAAAGGQGMSALIARKEGSD